LPCAQAHQQADKLGLPSNAGLLEHARQMDAGGVFADPQAMARLPQPFAFRDQATEACFGGCQIEQQTQQVGVGNHRVRAVCDEQQNAVAAANVTGSAGDRQQVDRERRSAVGIPHGQ
jgi:hypothetical protein